MTRKLYEQDAYIKEFTAKVLDCVKTDDGYKIVLDETAFFPEGGGQASDIGILGDVSVYDVQINDGVIYHYTKNPIESGSVVCGKIDFDRRFNFMQNHTGEHIVSGLIHGKYGYHNVGFHMGSDAITLDINGELTADQVRMIEIEANQAIEANLPIVVQVPEREQYSPGHPSPAQRCRVPSNIRHLPLRQFPGQAARE